jgi:cell volume regulation protein A
VAGGRLLAHGLVRLQLNPGLYPLLALFGGLLIFGVTAELNASGFIAIYLAGLTVGNRVSRGLYSVQRFHDGMAWMAQISLFLILGLLVTPAELLLYAPGALLVGLVLMFIARPVAVWLSLLPFRFTWREQVFISWVGLRGAVPIVLAMFPWMAGLEQWSIFFNIAFFIVLMSLLLQGITIAPLAKFFLLNIPSGSGSSRVQRSELGIPGQSEYEIVGYKLAPDSPALDCTISTLTMPGDSKLFSVLRDDKLQDVESDLSLRSGDHVYLLAQPNQLLKLDTLFVGDQEQKRLDEQQFFGEFILNPLAKLTELGPLYGFSVPEQHARWSISHYIHSRYPHPVVGDRVRLGDVEFVVREMRDARMTKVGLKLPH